MSTTVLPKDDERTITWPGGESQKIRDLADAKQGGKK